MNVFIYVFIYKYLYIYMVGLLGFMAYQPS